MEAIALRFADRRADIAFTDLATMIMQKLLKELRETGCYERNICFRRFRFLCTGKWC
jgi:hypothetical protein